MIATLAQTIDHTTPRDVALSQIEDELSDLRREALGLNQPRPGSSENGMPAPALRASTLTLAVLCDSDEQPADLEPLVSRIVESHPARVILIAPNRASDPDQLDTRVSAYCVHADSSERLVGEEVDFYPHGAQYAALPSVILSLRVSGLPFVLYWRGQPDLEDPLFHALVGECDQILFDSQHFTARAERINNTIARLRIDYPQVSFGDVNWQRIRPWRELTAQFFDDPANMPYLDTISRVDVDFSVNLTGNQSASVLLMAWLASSLGWRVVPGSYQREGLYRGASFERRPYGSSADEQIQVHIRVREQFDCQPGEITGIRIEAQGDQPTVFEIKRAVGGFVDIKQTTGAKFNERCATLMIPEDSMVVTSELDAVRRDRNYHRALELLDALVSSSES